MPNWCEGWVKFRGSRENLEEFIRGEFNGAEPELSYLNITLTAMKFFIRYHIS